MADTVGSYHKSEQACILKCYPMQLKSGLDQGHGTPCWYLPNVPAFTKPFLKHYNVHTICLLVTKMSLKAYNVSTCYQENLEASQMKEHLNACHQSVLLFVTHTCPQTIP